MSRSTLLSVLAASVAISLSATNLVPANGIDRTWTTPASVSDVDSNYFESQDLEPSLVSAGSSVVTAWKSNDGTDSRLQASSSTDGGITWDDPVYISGAGGGVISWKMASHGGVITAIWSRYQGSTPYLGTTQRVQTASSRDGGSTWSEPVDLADYPASIRVGELVAAGNSITATWQEGGGEYRLATSFDGGATWSAPVSPDLALWSMVTNGTTLTALTSIAGGSLGVTSSADGGTTWSVPIAIPETGGSGTRYSPQLKSDGSTLSAIWTYQIDSFCCARRLVQVASSLDGGATWTSPETISEVGEHANDPRLVFDANSITAYWTRDDGHSFRLQAASSTDRGTTWTSPVTISDAGKEASAPRIVTDGTTMTATWRWARSYDSFVVASTSTDSGRTWTTPVYISSADGLAPEGLVEERAWNPQVLTEGNFSTVVWIDLLSWEVMSSTLLPALTSVPEPLIEGAVEVGSTVRASTGTWAPDPVGLSYQWLRDGSPIAGAVAAEYLIVAVDIGARLSVRVTGSKEGFSNATVTSAQTEAVVLQPAQTTRLAGADRYLTSVAISQQAFPTSEIGVGVPLLFVASGTDFPDALSAGPVVAQLGGPILLTTPGTLPASVRSEIARLEPQKILVIGGLGAVSGAVFSQLEALAPEVERLGGNDRYETSRIVTDYGFSESGASAAYVATGEGFADALAAGAAAGRKNAPVILVPGQADDVDSETLSLLRNLNVGEIFVVGGEAAVSRGVLNSLGTVAPVQRLSGEDRLRTAQEINREAFDDARKVYLAYAFNFPDALGGGVLATVQPGPLFTVPSHCVPLAVISEIRRIGGTEVVLLGGSGVLGSGVAALQPCA